MRAAGLLVVVADNPSGRSGLSRRLPFQFQCQLGEGTPELPIRALACKTLTPSSPRLQLVAIFSHENVPVAGPNDLNLK